MYQTGALLSIAIALIIPDAIAYLIFMQFLPDLLASNLAGIIGGGLASALTATILVFLEFEES